MPVILNPIVILLFIFEAITIVYYPSDWWIIPASVVVYAVFYLWVKWYVEYMDKCRTLK